MTTSTRELTSHPMTYFHKMSIREHSTGEQIPPVQVVFPSGGFSIAVSAKPPQEEDIYQSDGMGTVASGPSNAPIDIKERFYMRLAFVLLGILNITITWLLYQYADIVDTSLVEPPHSGLPGSLQRVSSSRTHAEQVNVGFIIGMMCIGMLGAIYQNASMLSLYALGMVTNFILSTYTLPYFAYSFRFVLDIFMLYCGLTLRSRYMYAFLPLHLHNH